ncbi:MAG: transporter substrate-binding domain-containing protein [Bacilli bacterium]|nr:transporter substrate-binding domain-containing protein [Bacilli bacterium]
MKKIKFVRIMLVAVLAFVFALVGCKGNKTDLEKVKDAGVINVGITIYDPMDYFAEDGETIIGFDADLANEFAEELGIRARFTLISWDEKVMELDGGYIDLIWNGMTASEELGKKIDFSTAYATNYQCVVVKKGNESGYNTSDDLKGKQVAVEKGSAGDTVISDIVTPNRVNAQLDALNEVKAGTSAAAVIDYTMAYSVVGKGEYTDLVIIAADKISFEQEVFAVGARQGSDIIKELNAFLAKKYKDGSLKVLAGKYGVAINDKAFE